MTIQWEAFLPAAREIPDRLRDPYYGVIRPDIDDAERLEYFAAVEVPPDRANIPTLVELELPAGQYAVFEHRGYAKAIDKTVDYIYATWLARSGYRHTWGPDLELYGPQWSADGPDSVMHYAVPVS